MHRVLAFTVLMCLMEVSNSYLMIGGEFHESPMNRILCLHKIFSKQFCLYNRASGGSNINQNFIV